MGERYPARNDIKLIWISPGRIFRFVSSFPRSIQHRSQLQAAILIGQDQRRFILQGGLVMLRLLQPLNNRFCRNTPAGIISLFLTSALLIFLAPLAMPPEYSWLFHSISESAAQGLGSAWIARMGMLLFGIAVLWLASFRKLEWPRITYWMHLGFSLFMLGAAAFSHKPWLEGTAVDNVEDLLHSIMATGMGFAFTIGVVVRLLQREESVVLPRIYDAIAIVVATLMVPIGALVPGIAGMLQRVMFLIAYFWFAFEALVPSGYYDVDERRD